MQRRMSGAYAGQLLKDVGVVSISRPAPRAPHSGANQKQNKDIEDRECKEDLENKERNGGSEDNNGYARKINNEDQDDKADTGDILTGVHAEARTNVRVGVQAEARIDDDAVERFGEEEFGIDDEDEKPPSRAAAAAVPAPAPAPITVAEEGRSARAGPSRRRSSIVASAHPRDVELTEIKVETLETQANAELDSADGEDLRAQMQADRRKRRAEGGASDGGGLRVSFLSKEAAAASISKGGPRVSRKAQKDTIARLEDMMTRGSVFRVYDGKTRAPVKEQRIFFRRLHASSTGSLLWCNTTEVCNVEVTGSPARIKHARTGAHVCPLSCVQESNRFVRDQSINLADITDLYMGCKTRGLMSGGRPLGDPDHCFSVAAKRLNRYLEVEAESSNERDAWFLGIGSMLELGNIEHSVHN